MENPIFSIATASIRPQYYQNFYSSISADINVPFEIIFVGPNPPTESMPSNFRHILSDASPCECVEIAVRNATGEYVLSIGDDYVFSDRFLDKLYSYTQKLDRDNVLISFRFFLVSFNAFGDNGLAYMTNIPTSHIVGCGPAFRRDIWMKLGGLDKRFYGSFCDMDMQMRFYEYGMQAFVTPDCIISEIDKTQGLFKEEKWKKKSLLHRDRGHGRKLLDSLWLTPDGQMSRTRLSPVVPF